MAWYNVGTVTVTNGSTVVTGAGTDFVSNVSARDSVALVSLGTSNEIASVDSKTQMTLARPWIGATTNGAAYFVQPTVGIYVDLALRALNMLTPFQAVIDGIGQGLIGDGTIAVPGMRFAADQDTGMVRLAPNDLGLVTGGTVRLRLRSDGTIMIGSISTTAAGDAVLAASAGGDFHRLRKGGGEGSAIASFENGAGLPSLVTQIVSGQNWSFAGAALLAGRHSTTGRSANLGGTINASGADYAEYMTKADSCGIIAKGDACGVDRDGKLTRSWAEAVMFKIKSTDPNLVGGDSWGGHLGARPSEPVQHEADDAAHAAAMGRYGADLTAFEIALEEARQTVDRIAYCGRVPVNFADACEPGDYLVAIANGGGIGLKAIAEADITFADYRRRVGRVLSIGADGRPIIDVMQG